MMKKVLVLLSCGLTICMLVACGGNDVKTIDGQVKTTVSAQDKGDTADTKADMVSDSTQAAAEVSHKGYVFETNGMFIEIDAEASQYTDQLGEPNSYFEAASCAFEGIDKMYTYSSFELDTYPTDGKDFVSTIIFKDDSITTPEGVRIGSSIDDVKAAYGEDYVEDLGSMTYEKDGMKLVFITVDNAVESIEYCSKVLD